VLNSRIAHFPSNIHGKCSEIHSEEPTPIVHLVRVTFFLFPSFLWCLTTYRRDGNRSGIHALWLSFERKYTRPSLIFATGMQLPLVLTTAREICWISDCKAGFVLTAQYDCPLIDHCIVWQGREGGQRWNQGRYAGLGTDLACSYATFAGGNTAARGSQRYSHEFDWKIYIENIGFQSSLRQNVWVLPTLEWEDW